jgi:hypothetical protein
MLSYTRRGRRAHLLSFWPFPRDLWESLNLFLNFKDPEELYQNVEDNRLSLLHLARIEQMFGFVSVTITALIVGAYFAG